VPARLAAAAPTVAAIVDARPLGADPAPRTALENELRRHAELALVADPELRAALGAVAVPPADCDGIAVAAVLAMAPLDDVRDLVAGLLGRELVCADQAGDRATAMAAAGRLRALGATGGVQEEVWARYPLVDATVDVQRQPLEVTTDPPGAQVWIDLARVERPPAVTAGRHLVLVALGERRRALYVDVKEGRAVTVPVELPPASWPEVRAQVRAWRRGEPTTPEAVAALARAAGLGAVYILRDDVVEAWAVTGGAARSAGRSAVEAPTLVAPPAAPKAEKRSPWIVAVAVGAAAVAVGLVVVASQSGSSTQRIEVKWP
jgi:hypothetical protein